VKKPKAAKPLLFSSELVSYLLADSAVLEFITDLPDGEGESAIEAWVMSRSFLRYVNACCCTPPIVPKKLIHLIRTIDICIQEHRNMVYNTKVAVKSIALIVDLASQATRNQPLTGFKSL
jgi:hypothetical protein